MHPPEVKAEALALVARGLNDCEVARRLGVPRTTVRDWRRPRYVKRNPVAVCPRCWRERPPMRFDAGDYAELLAMYLGDGCIARTRGTYRLRVSLDPKYPGLIEEWEGLLRRFFPANSVSRVACRQSGFGGASVNLSVYNGHLPCLLPQHGPGRKHARSIRMEPWQMAAVLVAPWRFLRGAFHTDGCRFVNRTGRYAYPSYHFANRSGDIAGLVALVCRRVAMRPRLTHDARRELWAIRLNRREDVLRMDRHLGPKV